MNSQPIPESPNSTKEFNFTSSTSKFVSRRRSQISQFGGTSANEARNIYYEQELIRSENEIFELRFHICYKVRLFFFEIKEKSQNFSLSQLDRFY